MVLLMKVTKHSVVILHLVISISTFCYVNIKQEEDEKIFYHNSSQIYSLNNVLDFLFPNAIFRVFAHLLPSFILVT